MILISALYTIDALTLTICNVFGDVNLIIEIIPKFCCNVRYKFYMSTRLRSTYSILDINKPVSRSNKSDFDSQYIGIRTQFTIVGPRICVKLKIVDLPNISWIKSSFIWINFLNVTCHLRFGFWGSNSPYDNVYSSANFQSAQVGPFNYLLLMYYLLLSTLIFLYSSLQWKVIGATKLVWSS